MCSEPTSQQWMIQQATAATVRTVSTDLLLTSTSHNYSQVITKFWHSRKSNKSLQWCITTTYSYFWPTYYRTRFRLLQHWVTPSSSRIAGTQLTCSVGHTQYRCGIGGTTSSTDEFRCGNTIRALRPRYLFSFSSAPLRPVLGPWPPWMPGIRNNRVHTRSRCQSYAHPQHAGPRNLTKFRTSVKGWPNQWPSQQVNCCRHDPCAQHNTSAAFGTARVALSYKPAPSQSHA
jgi:hypothetical protein